MKPNPKMPWPAPPPPPSADAAQCAPDLQLAALCASPIACDVANIAAGMRGDGWGEEWRHVLWPELIEALDAIEQATRESPLRKVRP